MSYLRGIYDIETLKRVETEALEARLTLLLSDGKGMAERYHSLYRDGKVLFPVALAIADAKFLNEESRRRLPFRKHADHLCLHVVCSARHRMKCLKRHAQEAKAFLSV